MNEHARSFTLCANSACDKAVVRNAVPSPKNDRAVAFEESVRKLALKLWPERGAAALRIAMHGGCDIRSAQRFMARQQGLSLLVFITLQQSEVGKPFHDLGMAGSRATWWVEDYEDLELAAKEKRARELIREVEQRRAKR